MNATVDNIVALVNMGTISVNDARKSLDLYGQNQPTNWNHFGSSVSLPSVTTVPSGFTVYPTVIPANLPPRELHEPVWNLDGFGWAAPATKPPKKKRARKPKPAIEVMPLDAKRKIRLED
jgi:hypothetical protein